MDRQHVILALRRLEPEMKTAGVLSVSVFGSMARGDSGPNSDVDVAVRLSESFSSGGFDYFGRLDDLARQLSRLLDCKVDVVAEPVRKERFQHEIDRDRALAFWQTSAAVAGHHREHTGSAAAQEAVRLWDLYKLP